jgi:citronellol/citronellal dehydrogenase
MARSRVPDIVADAAYEILRRDPRECTGNTFIDDEILAEAGIVDLNPYAGTPDAELALDIFVDGWPEGAAAR